MTSPEGAPLLVSKDCPAHVLCPARLVSVYIKEKEKKRKRALVSLHARGGVSVWDAKTLDKPVASREPPLECDVEGRPRRGVLINQSRLN